MERTQEEKLLGGLAHVAVLFSVIGLIFNLVIFFIYKPKSAFVTNHAKQALGLTVIGLIVNYVLGPILGVGFGGMFMMGRFGSFLGLAAIVMLLGLAIFVLVIIAAIKGFQGQEYKYPLFGEFVAGINI